MKKLYPIISTVALLGISTAMTGTVMAASPPTAQHHNTIQNAATTPATPSCVANVGGTGLSAAIVAKSGQTISDQTVNAAGCDIGIYVGSGVSGVTINSDTVTGASFQGILAEKTTGLTVENSTFTNNGFKTVDPSAPPLAGSGMRSLVSQAFAVSLFGVSNSTVKNNQIYDNGRGGMGIMDNGPNDPGSITQNTSAPLVASLNDAVIGNHVWENYAGCGIVLATQNLGGHLGNLTVTGNTVTGVGMSKVYGPVIGGIVVAADLPNSTITNVMVNQNTVTDSYEGGLIVNSEAPGSSTQDVQLIDNTLADNNQGHLEAPNTAGIIIYAATAATLSPNTNQAENTGTVVAGNSESGQVYGIWTSGDNQVNVGFDPFAVHFPLLPTHIFDYHRVSFFYAGSWSQTGNTVAIAKYDANGQLVTVYPQKYSPEIAKHIGSLATGTYARAGSYTIPSK